MLNITRDGRCFRGAVKFTVGMAVLFITFPHEVVSTFAELPVNVSHKPEMIDHIPYVIRAPEEVREQFHQAALEDSEKAAFASIFPKVATSFQQSYVRSDPNSGFLSNFSVEIPIFAKGTSLMGHQAAKYDNQSYRMFQDSQAARRSLEFRLIYYRAQSLTAQIPHHIQKMNLWEDLLHQETVLAREKLKQAGYLNFLQKQSILSNEVITRSKAELDSLKARIAYFTEVEEPDIKILDPHKLLSEVPVGLFQKMRERALEEHPDLKRMELELQKQEINVKVAAREWLPEVSAVSNYTHDPRFVGNENQVFAGFRVQWDLWDFGTRKHERNKERNLYKELDTDFQNSKRLFALRIDNAFHAYTAAFSYWLDRAEYSMLEKDLLDSIERRFQQGELSKKDFLTARIEFLEGQIELEGIKQSALEQQAELAYLLGY